MNAPQQETIAFSKWESEKQPALERSSARPNADELDNNLLTNAESMQLRLCVIALENLMIALLVEVAAPQLVMAHELAAYALSRSGCTPHPVTLHAADEILSLVNHTDQYPAYLRA